MNVVSLTSFATNSNNVSNWTIQKAKKASILEIRIITVLSNQTHNKLRAMIYSLKYYSTQQDLM